MSDAEPRSVAAS